MSNRQGLAGRSSLARLSIALFLLLLASGCGSGVTTGGSTPPTRSSPEESATVTDSPATAQATLECGRPFRPPAGAPLTLTGRFPATVSAGAKAVSGTVDVRSTKGPLAGVIVPTADVFLVRDGLIVTLPLPQDSVGTRLTLAEGKVVQLPAPVALTPCDPGAGGSGSVSPGTYRLYARVILNDDLGSSVESFGGPWPLTVT